MLLTCRRTILIGLLLALVSGCARMGPQNLQKDRFDYTAAVGDSWKEQILLNAVRIRYGEWPTFVTVDQIVSAYTLEHTGSARVISRNAEAVDGDYVQPELGWIGKFSERPTVLYKPLSGEKFTSTLLTPTKPSVILSMIETGWPADHLSRVAMRWVNGEHNTLATFGSLYRSEPGFTEFVELMRAFQLANAMRVRISKRDDDRRVTELTFYPQMISDELQQRYRNLQAELGLSLDTDTYRVVRDSHNRQPDEIALRGRSTLEIFTILASGVEIPEAHRLAQAAPRLSAVPKSRLSHLPPLFTVRSGPQKPEFAHAAVEYLGNWFWIDQSDHDSKRTLAFVLAIMTLLDNSEEEGGNVVITVD